MIGMAVVLADVERPFAVTGIVDAAGGHVAALGPVLEIGTGTHPGFEKGTIPVRAIAAAHEDSIADAFAADVAFDLLTRGGEAFWKREKQMRRGRAGHGGAGVEVLEGHALGVLMRHAVAPTQKVRRGHALDGADFVRENAAEARVAIPRHVPEREVLRVESPFGDHRRVLHLFPMNAVRRGKGIKTARCLALMPVLARLLYTAERLVALCGLRVRIRIQKRREVVRLDAAPDHIVVLRAARFDQT